MNRPKKEETYKIVRTLRSRYNRVVESVAYECLKCKGIFLKKKDVKEHPCPHG